MEPEAMDVGGILRMVAATAFVIAALALLVFQIVDLEAQAVEARAASESQLTALRTADMAADEKLMQYGVVDAANGVYRIPIDRAMEILTSEARQDGSTDNPDELSGS